MRYTTAMSKLHDLSAHGQSIWYDDMRRSIFAEELSKLIKQGLRGMTSNPSIFEKAITQSESYDAQLEQLVHEGKDLNSIYEALVFQDIAQAADMMRPIYKESDALDGYISLEVSPELAHDTEGTVAEGVRFFQALQRPNIMIKVPATAAGLPAIRQLLAQGINVNVTLMFSLEDYTNVAEAYQLGLEDALAAGRDLRTIASVASFFISRLDGKIDPQLDAIGTKDALALRGTIAIDNAKIAYARFQEIFSSARWQALAQQGAQVQRPLWASTSTKDPSYPDTLYVDSLIGKNTVNTVPPHTLTALLEHATVEESIIDDVPASRARLAQLATLGIDLAAVTQALQEEGVEKFAASFRTLRAALQAKIEKVS